ncbi:MAG TPA: hypothetical protein VLK65_02275 [Vicinamibacteria bacterium]|nr:hypothetical protein [Vicinamibacteria bacterium]
MPRRFVICAIAWITSAASAQDRDPYVRYLEPGFFTYDELAAMSRSAPLSAELDAKIESITTSPFISNEAYYRGAKPHRPIAHHLGPSLRFVLWNIERGLRLDDIKLLFTDREAFVQRVVTERYEKRHPGDEVPEDELEADAAQNYALLRAQLTMMETADVIALSEVDWGMPRTQYREVIRELGDAFDMNWAYGVEFIEIDPKVVGTESFDNYRIRSSGRSSRSVHARQDAPEGVSRLRHSFPLSHPKREAHSLRGWLRLVQRGGEFADTGEDHAGSRGGSRRPAEARDATRRAHGALRPVGRVRFSPKGS